MDISGIDRAELLAALYNGARQQGMGFMHQRGASGMTTEQAREELKNNPRMYFDYLHGRVMKIGIKNDDTSTALYNRDNGNDAAERIIEGLRSNVELRGRAL